MRTPIRYALWSLLTVVPLMFVLMLHASAASDGPRLTALDVGPMTAVLTLVTLALSATIAPGVADSKSSSFPGWSIALIVACVAQCLALLIIESEATEPTAWSHVYVPSAIVCLNLTLLTILHAWTTSRCLGLSPIVGLLTGGACSTWVICVGRLTSLGSFHAASGLALFVVLGVVCIIAIRTPADTPVAD